MGGCYSGSSDCAPSRSHYESESWKRKVREKFRSFLQSGSNEEIVAAQKAFMDNNKKGFIASFARLSGLGSVEDIPKEFPDIEYEVKFDVMPFAGTKTKSEEPSVVEFMNAFDFPASRTARFLKDPINAFAIGVNSFYGTKGDERLVIIEKGGGVYLKEKGPVSPISLNPRVMGQEVVIKRTEKRYAADLGQVLRKVEKVCKDAGVDYRGRIRKEKGDFFVLDANDGRIYSASFTRAHLIKPDESKESAIQRQLELEYAGYIPGFPGFENGERPIVQGMVDLARYTFALYHEAPVARGWRMRIGVTGERKYDFILGGGRDSLENKLSRELPMPERLKVVNAG